MGEIRFKPLGVAMLFTKMFACLLVVFCAGCGSFSQPKDEVWRRLSGESLQYWEKLDDASRLHWPYAWTALAAYRDSEDTSRSPLSVTDTCPEPHQRLELHGWKLWDNLPLIRKINGASQITSSDYPEAAKEMNEVHLRAEVWSHKQRNEVIVAFGGTAFTNIQDWKSNARWFLEPFNPKDAYTVISTHFVAAFEDEYNKRSKLAGWEWLEGAKIISSGHSLGGGLAQRFAYSLQAKDGSGKIKEVFAFHSSPVSGKHGVPFYRQTAQGLTIYRIYSRGEVLAGVRSALQWLNFFPLKDGQQWIDLRYRNDWTWKTLLPAGWVSAHRMQGLACYMNVPLPQ